MTPASQIMWLEDRIRNLEERLNEVERYNKPIATPDVMRQARWMPIPKPLTDEAVGLLIGNSVEGQSWLMSVVRAVERAHGIGEKE
jgi:hypothetical protein